MESPSCANAYSCPYGFPACLSSHIFNGKELLTMNTRSSLCSLAPDAPLRSALDAARPRPASSASASAKAARVRKRPTARDARARPASHRQSNARENKSASILFARIESNRIMHLIPRRSSILFARARERARARASAPWRSVTEELLFAVRRMVRVRRGTARRARVCGSTDRDMPARDARGGRVRTCGAVYVVWVCIRGCSTRGCMV